MKFANPWAEVQSKFHPIETMKMELNPMEKIKCETNPFYNPFNKKK